MKRLFLTLLALPTIAFAQNEQKHLRLIPLGELPDWEEDLKDGIRVQKEAPPGSLPPQQLSAPNGDGNAQILGLTLRQMSNSATFGANVAGLNLHKGEQVQGEPYLTAPLTRTGFNLGILFRDNAKMTWDAPKMLMLPDDKDALPVGSIRFVNVSDLKAIVKVGGKSSVIQPGGHLIKPLVEGNNSIVAGYYDKEGAIVMVFQNVLPLRAGERIQAFFYKAQGKKPRSDVKFISFPERLPRP